MKFAVVLALFAVLFVSMAVSEPLSAAGSNGPLASALGLGPDNNNHGAGCFHRTTTTTTTAATTAASG